MTANRPTSLALMMIAVAFMFAASLPARQEDSARRCRTHEEKEGVMFALRRDPVNGVGGTFSISISGRELRTEWGYGDTEPLPGSNRTRLTLLSSPVGSEQCPNLRLIIQLKPKPLGEYLGEALRLQRARLRLNPESERLEAGRGSGEVVIEKLYDGWLEGRFKFLLDGENVSGTFKVRFHQPPEQ